MRARARERFFLALTKKIDKKRRTRARARTRARKGREL